MAIKGPNTGGMGAYSRPTNSHARPDPATSWSRSFSFPLCARHASRRIRPSRASSTLALIMTTEGPKLLEYNVRLGDPETQAILHSFQGDLLEMLMEMTRFRTNKQAANAPSASPSPPQNYPETPRTGTIIVPRHRSR